MSFVNKHGQTVVLGKKLGSGGEGFVAELSPRHANLVAKVYHKALDKDKQQKLLCMAQITNEDLTQVAAWPVDVLYDKSKKSICGFLMQNLAAHTPIHSVYGSVDRKAIYPDKDWVFLVNVARNIAASFAVMHKNGIVIGDINPNSAYVFNNSIVKLIDCDSFQLEISGKIYPCFVGQREFVPPELRKLSSFDTVRRTQNHDNFCLAILIFYLLLMGRHPFAGVFSGSGDMPIEKAIEKSLYAYSLKSGNSVLSPPPGAMQPSILSNILVENFEKAFSVNTISGGRPQAIEWLRALDAFKQKLRTCGRDPVHKYYSDLTICPWCKNEKETSHSFFVSKIAISSFNNFDFKGVWAKIESIAVPEPALPIPSERNDVTPNPLPSHLRIARFFLLIQRLGIVGIALGVISASPASWIIVIPIAWLLFAAVKNDGLKAEIQTRRAQLTKAQASMNEARKCWDNMTGDKIFKAKKQELIEYKTQHENLQTDFSREKTKLQQAIRQNQLERFLSNYHIANSNIDGIGPARKATLRSFGIETAADIQHYRIMSISGFGPHLAGKLNSWRRSLEARFVYDPTKGIDPADMTALQQKFALRKRELEGKLLAGPEDLMAIKQTIKNNHERLLPKMKRLSLNLAQAISDLAAVGK